MTFIDNKYSKIYYSIVSRGQSRTLLDTDYVERHHIIPKSLGGSNNPNNIVRLTAREHYICHLLLTYMTFGQARIKMLHAAWRMMCKDKKSNRNYRVTSRTYQRIKEDRAAHLRTLVGPKNPNFGKKTGRTSEVFTDEWRKNLSLAKKGKSIPWNKGIPHTEESKEKMSISRKERSKDPLWNIRPPCSKEKANKIATSLKGKRWANNGNERRYVSPVEFQTLIALGWSQGIGKF